MLNQQRLDTTEVISGEMEEHCEAMEEFNREAKKLLVFVVPVLRQEKQ